MFNRKESYVLFEEGKLPRVYVNPLDKGKLMERGVLVKKPTCKKLNAIPMQHWKLVEGKIIVNKKEAGIDLQREIETPFLMVLEEKLMEERDKVKELTTALGVVNEKVGDLSSSIETSSNILISLEREAKRKCKQRNALLTIAVIQAIALIITYIPEIKALIK